MLVKYLSAVCAYSGAGAAALGLATSPYDVSLRLAQQLGKATNANYTGGPYEYATDLTRNIVPKQLHSHNDYWRDEPLFSALSVGAISVEADVWLYNGTLYVGHTEAALTPERTFKSLYVDPLLKLLSRNNQETPFTESTATKNGVFDMDLSQTLYLFVDIKTAGNTTFPAAIRELEPLRQAGYLTRFATTSGVVTGPVTIIGTGNTPLDQVAGVSPRDYFFDAPLAKLNSSTYAKITANESVIASADFEAIFGKTATGDFNSSQLALLQEQVENARSRGIGARYWDTPGFPLAARNAIWATLWKAGVALINVDDLVAGAGFSDFANAWGQSYGTTTGF